MGMQTYQKRCGTVFCPLSVVTECGFAVRENTTIVSISRLLRECPLLLLLLQPPEELCYSPFLGTAVTSPPFPLANRRRPPLPPPLEVEHRRQQLPGGEVRPQRGGEVHSGVRGGGGALPQQKVRQADLAGGPTEMTHISPIIVGEIHLFGLTV